MQTIALYGNSLALSSVGASLQGHAGLRVLSVDASTLDAARRLEALQPDVIIFDLTTVRPEPNISLWKVRPNILLVGVDLAHDKMLVLSRQPARAVTIKDLIDVINTHAEASNSPTRVLDVAYLRRFAATGMARIPTRQRKFVFALAGVMVCVALTLGLSLVSSNTNAPLVGTAVDSGNVLPAVVLVAGIVLTIAGLVLWLHWHSRKNDV